MSPWTEVYTRCMDGEYFRGRTCPRDGYFSDTSVEVDRIVAALREIGTLPSLESLAEAGFAGPLNDVIIVQFVAKANADWLILNDGSPEVAILMNRPH
jgi:hypothetical protein